MSEQRNPLQRTRLSKAAQRANDRAARNDVPPLFEIAGTTKVLAFMAAVGPVSRKEVESMRPGVNVRRVLRVLKPYIECGLVITFRLEELRQQPQLWGLNPKHHGAILFRSVLRAVWKHDVKPRLRSRHVGRYRIPFALRLRRSAAPMVYRRVGYRNYGEILHVLADLRGPIGQTPLIRVLRANSGAFTHRVTVLVTLGLIKEAYARGERVLCLNRSHPVVPALARWMRYVNRHSTRDFTEMAHRLRAYAEHPKNVKARRYATAAAAAEASTSASRLSEAAGRS